MNKEYNYTIENGILSIYDRFNRLHFRDNIGFINVYDYTDAQMCKMIENLYPNVINSLV